jgi:hypothetical protein
MRALRVVPAVVIAIALGLPAGAPAHGDPASHSLETQSLYVSFTAQPSLAVELQLRGYLAAAERAGSPARVTLVAGEADVTEDPSMLRAPQRYAEFVEGKLSEVAARPLGEPVVVVTPYGIGVAGRAMRRGRFGPVSRAGARALVGGLEPGGATGDDLGRAAMTMVRRIARAGGNPLPAHVPPAKAPVPAPYDPPGGGLGGWLPLFAFGAVFLGAAALYEIRVRYRRSWTTFTPTPRREHQ